MNCWTFGTAFNRVQLGAQLMESASSRLRKGERRTFGAPSLIEWAVIEAVKQCYKFIECVFFQIHKLIIKVLHSFVIFLQIKNERQKSLTPIVFDNSKSVSTLYKAKLLSRRTVAVARSCSIASTLTHLVGQFWSADRMLCQRSKVKLTARWNALFWHFLPIDLQPSVRCPCGGGTPIDGAALRVAC